IPHVEVTDLVSTRLSLKDCLWELYHLDCRKMTSILMNHPKIHRCSGFYFVYYLGSHRAGSAWNSKQAELFGESFLAWNENVFPDAVAAILTALPLRKHTVVWFCWVSLF